MLVSIRIELWQDDSDIFWDNLRSACSGVLLINKWNSFIHKITSYAMFLLFDYNTDDITEMYRKLRSLVLEYLGILPTPTKQLSDVEMLAPVSDDACVTAGPMMYSSAEGRQVHSLSAPLPVRRLWSHPSIIDSSEPVTRGSNVLSPQTKSPPTAAARGSVVSTDYQLVRLWRLESATHGG